MIKELPEQAKVGEEMVRSDAQDAGGEVMRSEKEGSDRQVAGEEIQSYSLNDNPEDD